MEKRVATFWGGKKPLVVELKKKLGGTEWKKEWSHFEEEKNTSCCWAKKKLGGTKWKEWSHFEEEKNTYCCWVKKKLGGTELKGVATFWGGKKRIRVC